MNEARKCYLCNNEAKFLDPFHPWYIEMNRCEECAKQIKAAEHHPVDLSKSVLTLAESFQMLQR